MRKLALLLLLLVVAASAFVLAVPVGPHTQTFLDIAPGTGSSAIAVQLQNRGLIWNRWAFLAMQIVKGGSLKAGYYEFDHPARMSEVYDRLHRGDVYTISVTIPEGSNMFDIAGRLEAAQLTTRMAFLTAVKQQTALVSDLDPHAPSLEGYLFPDTYKFTPHTSAAQLAAAMVKRFRQAAEQIGLNAAPGVAAESPSTAQPDIHRIVTLASLVERETPIPAERPLVASVFDNRLAKSMPLETDPSVIYAALLENRYRGTIYQSDLAADSAYNTYRHPGLPPGPICNPGLDSLKAAFKPAQTNYLYFVAASADPSGHSQFSATLEEHAKAVQAYRRAVRQAQTP